MITYGDVDLTFPLETEGLSVQAWIDAHFPYQDITEFERPTFSGKGFDWSIPGEAARRPIRLGHLYWPRTASRWAEGHFLATDAQLASITDQVYGPEGNQRNSVEFKLDDGTRSITADLYMLPPRPISAAIADGEEGLWLLTLVDDRYFWWDRPTTFAVTEGTTGWASLIAYVGSALGVSITHTTIEPDYADPSVWLTSNLSPSPLLLDAIAYSVGRVVVRKLDGTVLLQSASDGETQLSINQGSLVSKMAGGEFRMTESLPNDLNYLPASVLMRFGTNKPFDTVEVTIDDTGLFGASIVGMTGSAKVVHTTRAKTHADEDDPFALQWATDWYRWQSQSVELTIAGVADFWTPEGYHDLEFLHLPGQFETRVFRDSWNDTALKVFHGPSDPPGLVVEYVQISKTTKIAGRYLGSWYSRNASARTWTEQAECWIDQPNDETLVAATKYLAKYISRINSPYGTLTITGNPLGGSFTITVDGETTAAIPWNAKASRVSVIPDAAGLTGGTAPDVTWTDATSTLAVTGSPAGGDFTVAVDGEATAAIAYNASAGDVQTALEALANLVPGDVAVTGSAGGPWVLTFVLSVQEALEALSTVGAGNVTVTGTGTVGLPPYGVTFATAPGEVSVDDSGLTGGTAPEVTWTWGPSSVFMTDAVCCGQGTDLSGPGIMTESGIVIESEAAVSFITESGE